jgi:predicted nucleotidyltransferase
MPKGIPNNLFPPALESVCQLLRQKGVHGMIIGGLAASLLGRPRFTNDIDLLILDLDGRIPEFIQKLKSFGIEPRISDVEKFAIESRVLLVRHTESGINIDISMGILPFEREAVERRRVESAHGLEIVLPTPEDLIIFKSISQRPVDIEDIKAILARYPDIDDKRILSAVREFADILEMPELYQNIESLLKY